MFRLTQKPIVTQKRLFINLLSYKKDIFQLIKPHYQTTKLNQSIRLALVLSPPQSTYLNIYSTIISYQQMSKQLTKFGEAYVSYGSYHNNRVNQWIHIICVPILTITFIAALSYIPLHYEFQGYTVGVDTLAVIVFLAIYLRLNLYFGLAMAVIFFLSIIGYKHVFGEIGQDPSFWKYLVGFHYATLAVQFVGHGVFEKRKPAMLDNFAESVSAPMFVLVQIGMMLGYKTPETDYWIGLIQKRVAQFRQKSKEK